MPDNLRKVNRKENAGSLADYRVGGGTVALERAGQLRFTEVESYMR